FTISPDIMVITDPLGTYKKVNPATLDILGYKEDEIIEKSFSEFIHPDDLQPTIDEKERQKKIGTTMNFENRYVCKDGTIKWLSWRANFNKVEKLTYATARDITARKLSEQIVQRYKFIVTSSSDMMALVDRNYTYLFVNESYAQGFNLKQEDFMELTIVKLLGKDFFESTIKPYADHCMKGNVLNSQEWLKFPAHPKRYVDVTYSPYKVNGQIEGFVVRARDISALKKTEEDLKASNQLLSLAQKSAEAGIWFWDMEANTLQWTDEIFFLFGLNPKTSQATFNTWYQVLHPDDIENATQVLNDSVKNKTLYESEYRIIYPDRQIHWISARGNTTYDNNDKPVKMAGFCIDITEKKIAENKLKEYSAALENINKYLENFGYVAVHDFKSPISNLQSLLCMLEEENGIKSEALPLFEKAKLALDNLHSKVLLLNEAINIGRTDAHQNENLSFEKIFSEIRLEHENQIKESGATIHADFSKCTRVTYPVIHLQSLMQNLLSNALKYRRPDVDPIIKISTSLENEYPCLIIEDNGLGIDLQLQKHKLFGLFKRFHTHVEGKGIGLYIVNSIVNAHNGKIEVTSEVNKGTTFKLMLSNGSN
ncbi:MAG TPA: PAS domain S-box protein, partial [Bacteroidia bacterium]